MQHGDKLATARRIGRHAGKRQEQFHDFGPGRILEPHFIGVGVHIDRIGSEAHHYATLEEVDILARRLRATVVIHAVVIHRGSGRVVLNAGGQGRLLEHVILYAVPGGVVGRGEDHCREQLGVFGCQRREDRGDAREAREGRIRGCSIGGDDRHEVHKLDVVRIVLRGHGGDLCGGNGRDESEGTEVVGNLHAREESVERLLHGHARGEYGGRIPTESRTNINARCGGGGSDCLGPHDAADEFEAVRGCVVRDRRGRPIGTACDNRADCRLQGRSDVREGRSAREVEAGNVGGVSANRQFERAGRDPGKLGNGERLRRAIDATGGRRVGVARERNFLRGLDQLRDKAEVEDRAKILGRGRAEIRANVGGACHFNDGICGHSGIG